MKNSTQIPFAFQDTPDPGENPGVGVRIKSLKKGANEKSSTEGTGENQPQVNSQQEKPADPSLFDENLTSPVGVGMAKSETENPISEDSEAKEGIQTEAQTQLHAGTAPQTQSGGQPQFQSEAESELLQSGAASHSQSETDPGLQSEADPGLQSGADPGLQSGAEPQFPLEAATKSQSGVEPQAQSKGEIPAHGPAQVNPNSDNLPQTSIKNHNSDDLLQASINNPNSDNLPQASINNKLEEDNKVEDQNVNQESTNLAEYDNAIINAQDQNEDDADIPVFRGSSLSAAFSASTENEITEPVTDNNEIESREVDELDNNSGTDKASKSTRGRKSLKTIDEGTELINIPPDEVLFQKQYYAIGEVAEMFHVNQSLLRFWETEFDIIQPRKNRKGDRHFRPIDIKNLLLIHDLLRRRKLTIEGAKDFLKKNKRSPERFAMIQSLQKIKGFILEIKATL